MARRKQGWTLSRDKRHESGNFQIRFTHAGKPRFVGLGPCGGDLATAQGEAARVYAEYVSGRRAQDEAVEISSRRAFDEVAALWLDSIESSLDPKTFALYRDLYVGTHYCGAFATIGHLTTVSVEDYIAARLRKVTRSTVKHELSPLRQLAAWAVARGYLAQMPLIVTPKKKVLGTPVACMRTRALIFTAIEVQRILAKLPEMSRTTRYASTASYPVRARFTLAWETGLRPETLASLRAPDDYRRGNETLIIRDEADKNRFGRALPLTPAARDALDRVCPEVGTIFGDHDFRIILRTAAREAGIDELRAAHITAYDLRHSRFTLLGQSSDNLTGMMFLAGWTQPATAAKYMRPQQAAAVEVLAAAVAAEPRARNHDLFENSIGSRIGSRGGSRAPKGGSSRPDTTPATDPEDPDTVGENVPSARRGTRTPKPLRAPAPQPSQRDPIPFGSALLERQEPSENGSKRHISVADSVAEGPQEQDFDPVAEALVNAERLWAEGRDPNALRCALRALLVTFLGEDVG